MCVCVCVCVYFSVCVCVCVRARVYRFSSRPHFVFCKKCLRVEHPKMNLQASKLVVLAIDRTYSINFHYLNVSLITNWSRILAPVILAGHKHAVCNYMRPLLKLLICEILCFHIYIYIYTRLCVCVYDKREQALFWFSLRFMAYQPLKAV